MRHKYLFIVIFGTAALLVACGGTPAPPVTPTETAAPPTEAPPLATETPTAEERGRVIFENGGAHDLYRPSYNCTECHSLDGSDDFGLSPEESFGRDDTGPSLKGISERAGERVPELSAKEYIRQSIMQPNTYITEGYNNRMSNVPARLLSEEEVDDLVAFLLTQ